MGNITIWDLEKHRYDTLTEEQHAKLLPARPDEYSSPPLDSILYDRKQDPKSGIIFGSLKEEFWELEHDDPHKAPREIRIAYVKAEIEKLCDQHDVTIFEAISALRFD